jgi:hypothetical protein
MMTSGTERTEAGGGGVSNGLHEGQWSLRAPLRKKTQLSKDRVEVREGAR